ncbi:hypothetical protein HRbin04_00102 [archaeon HR04]|nr:hypothetical protein HRbin04_00102 [archaeon HR04]
MDELLLIDKMELNILTMRKEEMVGKEDVDEYNQWMNA